LALRKLKRFSTSSNLTKLKRVERTDKLFERLKRPALRDILETDEFESVELTTKERLDLESTGWTPMSSSNVRAIRIENSRLEVQFHQGSTYYWSYNAQAFYEGLIDAPSAGRYIWENMYGTHSGHN